MSGDEQVAKKDAGENGADGGVKEESGKADSDNGSKGNTAATPASGAAPAESLKVGAEDMIKRRTMWQSSLAALRYVSSLTRDNEVKIRDSDRATARALLLVCAFALLTLILPLLATSNEPPALQRFLLWMNSQRTPIVGAADVLVGIALLRYVANRFGIMTTLTPRQALLCWHLMLGASLLGIFMAINLAIACWVAVDNSYSRIVIPEAHPQVVQQAPRKQQTQVPETRTAQPAAEKPAGTP